MVLLTGVFSHMGCLLSLGKANWGIPDVSMDVMTSTITARYHKGMEMGAVNMWV